MKYILIILLFPVFLLAGCGVQKGKEITLKIEDSGLNMPIAAYALRSPDASRDKKFRVLCSKLTRKDVPFPTIAHFNEYGIALTDQDCPFYIVCGETIPGEPVVFSLIALDESEKGSISIVDHPLMAEQNGYKISLEHTHSDLERLSFLASGFEPNEEVSFMSKSYDEVLMNKAMVDADGELFGMVLPGVIGKSQGVCKVEVTGKKGSVSLEFDWGRADSIYPKMGL